MDAAYLANLFTIQGKTAILTGATGGLGSAIALGLAKAGANIVSIEMPGDPNSNALQDLISQTKRQIVRFECELADAKSLRACWSGMWAEGVVPDVLVNVAGVMRRNRAEAATDEEIDALMAINQRAIYINMQEFGKKCLELQRPGKIVNISSVTAFQANINTSAYGMTKAAVVQMTKAFSNEWAGRGINVNAIAPGFMRTSMTEVYARDEQYTAYLMQRVPAGRWGLPEDLVGAVIYLASQASNFVNGATLVIDGGFCAK
ncbi:2-deoxy-D-gluconate 3-dehydrogenase [Polyplosphaeria fusca]|uniref:2-deoxy-D-gluconate 3-dehydrogenase n=1 Tax=Polyplosphaeria fusca TaxID=682080 RepID=A0A9P4UXE1_9PLEO|nr:2-deoxy-D-gluconate 3-dehydrogenase [Polyplosphaeria fusca]